MLLFLTSRFRIAAMLIAMVVCHVHLASSQQRTASPAEELQALIMRGRDLANQPTPDQRGMVAIVKACIRVARAAAAADDQATVKDAWNAVIGGLDIAGDQIATAQQAKIRIAAAQTLRDVLQAHDAIAAVRPVLESTDEGDFAKAEQLLLGIGSKNYQAGHYGVARLAWQGLADHDGGHPTASLGLAWLTLAEQPGNHAAVAAAMKSFADSYPSHPDALTAMQQAAIHFAKARQVEAAIEAFQFCTDRCVEQNVNVSDEVVDAIVAMPAEESLMEPVAVWLCENRSRLANTSRALLSARVLKDNPVMFEVAIDALLRLDQRATVTRELLNDVGGSLVAPLIAARLKDHDVKAANKLVAVQWLAKESEWASIATGAGISPDQLSGEGAAHATLMRLIAESFTRTSDQASAHEWWTHVVDVLGDDSFVSALRLAESSVEMDSTDQARQRIKNANAAAHEKPAQIVLVQFLRARVAIRDARLAEARQSLESIIRNVAITTDLRARAQFMLGETHYMQEDFAAAIGAYRLVEGISPESDWAAASLVQAGKSFERLGRTQAAAVCYGNLLSRFADSQHADTARSRVAALSPDARPHPQPSDPILRR